jgi:hypothetical protein
MADARVRSETPRRTAEDFLEDDGMRSERSDWSWVEMIPGAI